ncbi:2-aminoethylphosphonate aminotransferase [Pigmentiphaga soli]|uniref:2-aminoethylphosphonate--pyruvate transaminase n=1 Tax=Pigmentiphaga soli TaxID=1007095 RepID=A0ABP8GW36_9BURK
MLLLNPGPVTLTERVRRAMLQPDLCHREPEFFDLQDEARTRLLAVYGLPADTWQAVLITGSGTAAVESMVASLVPEDGRLLVIENGVYGERIAQIAAHYRIDHEAVRCDWLQAPDPAAIVARLDAAAAAGRPFTHAALIHHETTTGRLNPVAPLAAACRERGIHLLLDGVSSFGAEAIDFAEEALAAVAAAGNKCLHGVPGLSFVMVRRGALARAARRAFYLDLGRLAELQDRRNTPFTPAVHACYALVEALRELDEAGGWRRRHEHYAALAERARSGLAALGIESMLPAAESSVVLRAYRLPARLAYDALHDGLKAAGFVIYAGQGGFSGRMFRISTMGDLHAPDIDRLLQAAAGLVD